MINVTCAIIEKDDHVLVTQRSELMSLPLKWEFPGGKINETETEEDCILREIYEELNINVKVVSKLTPNIYQYPNKKIKLIPFVCHFLEGQIILLEHKEYKWLKPHQLKQLDWAEADLPILEEYLILKNA
ncbi:DNA mismatch repair protein MutT [Solitalea longa]|uniref:8-oxo-dGTP diphosphatase n=1 Tax=Solitalea longa TaxID=2079460 RepID=A0A2S4ZWH5_9SPHI|nr:(deoxy)nucleoside triphosphate pyrophosphohydrolase [Solitalea longa]POY34720.1 DNA mismatch repair protein MutT [Solitalea longa]